MTITTTAQSCIVVAGVHLAVGALLFLFADNLASLLYPEPKQSHFPIEPSTPSNPASHPNTP